VHGRLGGAGFTLRIDATLPAPRAGETVRLAAPAVHLHWFAADTGRRLAAAGETP
jgi:sn-glycerol 3-phosphate transport system ATP-binding protein